MFNFKIEGSFTGKPSLTIDGQEVPFETLEAVYYPAVASQVPSEPGLPEFCTLQFSIGAKVGNLEANTIYRVRANAEGKLVFEKAEKMMPPMDKKSAKPCPDCGKVKCECKDMPKSKSTIKELIVKHVGN